MMEYSKRKDVLFLCQFFYPEYVSSATLPFDTAVGLADSGLSVSAMCGYPKEYCDRGDTPLRERAQGVDIHRLRYLQLKRGSVAGRLINYFSFTASVLLHFHEIGKYKAVIVYTNPPVLPLLAVWAKRLMKTRVVFVVYDVYPEMMVRAGMAGEGGFLVRAMRRINNKVYRGADCIVAVCEDMKRYIAESRPVKEKKVVSIPNWYEDRGRAMDGGLCQNRFRERYAEKMVVSYFGNMGTCQDIDTILGAVRLLRDEKDIRFMFAGHGNKMGGLKEAIEKEGLQNADVYGFLKGQDYDDALSVSDCAIVSLVPGLSGLCSPSKTYGYMMAGLPVIAIMEKGEIVNDLVGNNAGIIVKNGESELLASEIRRLSADKRLREAMGKNSRDIFLKKYEKRVCIGKYIRLMDRIIK